MSITRLTAALLAASVAAMAGTTHAETWIVRTDLWGNPAFSTLSIDRKGNRISGDLDGDRIDGNASGDRLTLTATESQC